jgi:hypothetical protein
LEPAVAASDINQRFAVGVPARVPGAWLTVVTTAKITAIANATENAAKTKRGTMNALPYSNNDLLIILPAFLLIPAEIRPVQDVKAPFDHFNDGNSYGDSESKKQNELDDHFCDT